MPHSCLTSWTLKYKKREVWERRHWPAKRLWEADNQKDTGLNIGTGRWTVLAVSAKCPFTSRQSSGLFLRSSLSPNVRGGSPIFLRVSIHLQARVTRQVIPRPGLFSGPESLTENSLWLCFVTVARASHTRPNASARTRQKHRELFQNQRPL